MMIVTPCSQCFHYGRLKDGSIGCAIQEKLRTRPYSNQCIEFAPLKEAMSCRE